MAAITIDTTELTISAKKLSGFGAKLTKAVDRVLTANTLEIARQAKILAPKDRGFLRQNISPDTDTFLEKRVTVNAPYAAYVEFGTGKLAAQYVAGLPPDWQSFAAKYKGKTGKGSFKEFVKLIAEWIKRKGIGASYSTGIVKNKGGKKAGYRIDLMKAGTPRRKNLATIDRLALAYTIARSIFKRGIKPQPFLFTAYNNQAGQIVTDLESTLTALKL